MKRRRLGKVASSCCWLVVLLALAGSPAARAQRPADFAWQQQLGAALPLHLRFTDQAGRSAPLAEQFGGAPVVLVLGYLRCSSLCGSTAVGAGEALAQARTPVRALFVSIDPADAANASDAQHLPPAWQVLSADESSVRALADAIGFRYAWDARLRQYVHPAGFVVATPAGTVSRYFPGVRFDAGALRAALADAAQGRSGALAERLLLLCRHLLPSAQHSAAIVELLRAAALLTLLGLGAFAWRTRRR